jgi:predicted dehydrogenase
MLVQFDMVDRLVIVGNGSIGQRHLRIARGLLPHADIRVLLHRNCEAIPEYANGFMTSLDEALVFAPQAAVIANPSTFHLQVAQPMAEAGVHLLIEKPLAASFVGVSQLLTSCAERGKVLMTAYNLRFLPSLQEYRRLIKSGYIGKVLSVRCEIGQFLPAWRPNLDYRHVVSASRAMGGGALLELSHEIDYLRWIFGEVTWAQASLSKQSNLEIDVEDTAHLILGFELDADGRELIASLNMDMVRHDITRQCLAIGEFGSLRWNGLEGIVEYFSNEFKAWKRLFEYASKRDESYIAEWQHFLACVRSGISPLISGQDGLATLKIIEAARCSAATNGATSEVEEACQ